jgi:hypothetical protein
VSKIHRRDFLNGSAKATLALGLPTGITKKLSELVARTTAFVVRVFSPANVFTMTYCIAVSKLRRPFLSGEGRIHSRESSPSRACAQSAGLEMVELQ